MQGGRKPEQRLRERPTNDWLNLRHILWERELTSDTITDTLLCLQTGTLLNCLLRVPSSNRWKQIQRPRAKHREELGEFCGRLVDRIEQARSYGHHRRTNRAN